ncbi:MAG: AlpA family phage regulatory protein [Nitrosospira sp.]
MKPRASLLKLPAVLTMRAESRTTFYNKIKGGPVTPPVQLGTNSVAWPEVEIIILNEAKIAGQSDDEIRALVCKLVAQRQNFSSAEAK